MTTSPFSLEASFADWYRTNHPGLAEAVVRAVRPEALACDALDEACTRAFASWEQVQAMKSPTGWVYRVAVNEARRQLRRADREQAVLAAFVWPTTSPPPGDEAWMVVGQLPIRQRTTVVLRHVAGMTEAEVAQAMGVTRSTVSSSLASAYRTLVVELDENEPKREPAVPMSSAVSPPSPSAERFLAVARSCTPLGCDVEHFDGTTSFAAYSPEVLDAIKVRPGDLVAVDADNQTVVWRWWTGTIIAVDGLTATVVRNVTQRSDGDPRQGFCDVDLPEGLADSIREGETVWFGTEKERKIAVAVAGPDGKVQNPANLI